MPLFLCSKCGMFDNTALANYWWSVQQEGKPPLCSLCDPEIGKWHDEWERCTPESQGYVKGPDGFLHHPSDEYYQRLLKEEQDKGKK